MTPRERLLSAIKKKEVDRLPFWVKIFTPSYLSFQSSKFSNMGELELVDYLQLDHLAGAVRPVVKENENFFEEVEQRGSVFIRRYKTKEGVLEGVYRFDAGSHSYHPVEYFIKDKKDLKIAFLLFTGSKFRIDEKKKKEVEEKILKI